MRETSYVEALHRLAVRMNRIKYVGTPSDVIAAVSETLMEARISEVAQNIKDRKCLDCAQAGHNGRCSYAALSQT